MLKFREFNEFVDNYEEINEMVGVFVGQDIHDPTQKTRVWG